VKNQPLLGLLLLIVTLVTPSLGAHPVWLETERFDSYGGWTNDSQFIDQVGSPYLMAIGLGKPVDDAVTSVTLPRPGRYRLWARTRDWVPEHHPGRFHIVLGGHTLDHVFGQNGKAGWHWEDGGVHELSGKVELRLDDLTGYYGRCDVIVLADELQWTPPAGQNAVDKLREQFGGVSRQVKPMGRYDVVVVGGGLAGCMAAVSSARSGARTVLIQNRPVLGGNASVEILVPPVGIWPHGKQVPLDPRETGLVEEIRTEGNQTTDEAKLYSARLGRLVAAEPNLDLHLNTHATGVDMQSDSTIGAVLAVNVRSGQRMRFDGRVFIDCTGDAVIGVAAGAEHRHGREGRATYDESMAPEVGDKKTMGNSLKYVSQPTDSPQPFEAPAWAMKFPRCDSFTPGRHPLLTRRIGWQWKIELGGTRDTYRDAEEIRDDLLRLIYGIWDHVKNHCDKYREKAANHKLVWVGHVAGKRENRRLIGDYVLNANDILEQTLFPDRVAYGGWSLDDHHPDGFFRDGHTMRIPVSECAIGRRYSIPYRSLYSKNIDNLLMAGRDISASHMALSDTRVMLTCAVIGHASGTAARMCIQHETTPRGIYQNHIDRLQQQLLKDGAHIIDLPNGDPCDLAQSATVTASSEKKREGGQLMAAKNVINGYARAAAGKTNAWGPEPGAPMPQWVQLTWNRPQSFNMVHVTFLTNRRAPARFAVQAWQHEAWKTLAEVDTGRYRRHVLGLDRVTTSKLRVVLLSGIEESLHGSFRVPRASCPCTGETPVAPDRASSFVSRLEAKPAEPAICEIRVYDEPLRLIKIARRAAQNMRLPDAKPDLPWDDSVLWLTGINPKKLPGIVIDDTRAETTGNWVHSEFGGDFIGMGYSHDGHADKGAKSICFKPNLPKAGRYEVRIAYTAYGNRATNTPVTIQTSGGTKTVHINQRVKPAIDGRFHSLGKFHLDAGQATSIVVGNAETDGYVVVDAVQLIP